MTEEVLKELMGESYKEDLTSEDITAFFKNQVASSGEYVPLTKYKSVEDKLKDSKEKDKIIADLQKQLDTKSQEGLSEVEKLQKQLEESQKNSQATTKELNKMKVENILIQGGLNGDDYKDILDGIVSEDLDKSTKLAENIVAAFKNKVDVAVKDQISKKMQDVGTIPNGATTETSNTDSKKLSQYSYNELLKMKSENPAMYESLTN